MNHPAPSAKKPRVDLKGQQVDRLLVLYYLGPIKREGKKNRDGFWYCHCACGTYTKVRTVHLTSRSIQSCGCRAKVARQMPITTQKELYRLYVHEELSLCACAERLAYTNAAYLADVLRRMGAPIRPSGTRCAPGIETLIATYEQTQSYTTAAAAIGISPKVARDRIRRYYQRQQRQKEST